MVIQIINNVNLFLGFTVIRRGLRHKVLILLGFSGKKFKKNALRLVLGEEVFCHYCDQKLSSENF